MATDTLTSHIVLTREQLEDLAEVFRTIDTDGNGTIKIAELGSALAVAGIKLSAYEIRILIQESVDKITDDQINFEDFKALYARLKIKLDLGAQFRAAVTTKFGLDNYKGMSRLSSDDTTHTVKREEEVAFANWINKNLSGDPDCQKYLPLQASMETSNRDLYLKCGDGILLCKMINCSSPGTIDERTINKGQKLNTFHRNENLTLAIGSAQSIGCSVVNIGPEDLQQGKPHLVLGLLWQVIRIGLFQEINLHDHPGLVLMLEDGETLEDLLRLTPEQMLIRWVNYHLARSQCHRRISNFTSDITDSVVYIHLLNQIAPAEAGVTTDSEREPDDRQRAELMLQEADKIGCRSFISPDDVVNGNYKLNLAFVANLFNNCPSLDERVNGDSSNGGLGDIDLSSIAEETREERMYRNWINSMDVSPSVYHIYRDLRSGLIIFQLYDIIHKGIVDWKRVIKRFNQMRMMMEQIENCNYVVELGLKCKFSLVGIDGKNLYDGNETLTLALVWQLMRAYTLSLLSQLRGDGHPIVDKEILEWANRKLSEAGKKTSIHSFNDSSIGDSMAIIDLVDACKPGSVNYSLIKNGPTPQERLENAKYAISMARKIGARVYALPEDIVEVKSKMVMTILACMMIRDLQPQQRK